MVFAFGKRCGGNSSCRGAFRDSMGSRTQSFKANFIQKWCSEGSCPFLQVIHSWLLAETLDEKRQEFVKFI